MASEAMATSRFERVLRWSLLILTGILGVAWLSTVWLSCVIFVGDFEVLIMKSAVYLRNVPGYQNALYWIGDAPGLVSHRHWPNIESSSFSAVSWPAVGTTLAIPIWMFMVIPAAGWLLLSWRIHRRVPEGHCRVCRYNLTGNTSGICPECGIAITVSEGQS